jgi:hypothetical protein
VSSMRRRFAVSALAALALALAGWLAFGPTPGRATKTTVARTTCVQRLLADWADGRIDRAYPVSCYRAAMKSLPADLEAYSSAPEDIADALRQRILLGSKARTIQAR